MNIIATLLGKIKPPVPGFVLGRGSLQGFIRGAVFQGMAGRQIYRMIMTAQGSVYRTQSFQEDVRYWKSVQRKGKRIDSFKGRPVPGREDFSISKGYQSHKYRYDVELHYINPDTREVTILHTSVGTEKRMSYDEARKIARERFLQDHPQYKTVWESAKVNAVFARTRRNLPRT